MTDYQNMDRGTRTDGVRSLLETGRKMAGLSQEELAAKIPVNVRTLRRYESGELETPDEVMLKVANMARCPMLIYKHMRTKYKISEEILPELAEMTLSQAVVSLLHELQDLEDKRVVPQLLMLVADGHIDPREAEDFSRIMNELNDVVLAVHNLTYCRKELY